MLRKNILLNKNMDLIKNRKKKLQLVDSCTTRGSCSVPTKFFVSLYLIFLFVFQFSSQKKKKERKNIHENGFKPIYSANK